MKILIVRLFLGLLFVFVSLTSSFAKPALWTVQDEDTTIYMFGTLHLAPKGLNWFDADLQAKFDSSQRVYFELSAEDMDPVKMMPAVMAYGMLSDGKQLQDVIPTATYQKLTDYLQKSNRSPQMFSRMRPWMVAVTLTVETYQEMGIVKSEGVETILTERAQKLGIAIAGLETAEDQLSIFGNLDVALDAKFLDQSLDEMGQVSDMFDGLTGSWMEGDLDKFNSLFNAQMNEVPELAEALLYKRNRNWAKSIGEILDEPGTFFIAVGAAHLVGEQSVPDLLKEQGRNITRAH